MIDSTLFENKNILVTGSSGLLGSWLVEDLLSMGCNVTGIAIDETKDDLLKVVPNAKTVPQIFVEDEYIGGYTELMKFFASKENS